MREKKVKENLLNSVNVSLFLARKLQSFTILNDNRRFPVQSQHNVLAEN